MKKEIRDFIEANQMKRRGMVRIGFELETQKTDGQTKDCEGNGEIDCDAANDAICEIVNDVLDRNSDLLDYVGQRLRDEIREAVYESASESFDYSEYYFKPIDSIKSNLNCNLLEVVEDPSVDGFEFRTKGGLKYSQAITAAKRLFKAFDHEIDEKCSFHVHISLPGVQHYYGERFQIALIEYLIEHADRLPLSVRQRFNGAPNNRFIKGMVSSREKYSFVYRHRQGTWEFRCFGNVQDYSGAIACINLAIEAMAYAYEITKTEKRSLTDGYGESLECLFNECLFNNRSISQHIRSKRKSFSWDDEYKTKNKTKKLRQITTLSKSRELVCFAENYDQISRFENNRIANCPF